MSGVGASGSGGAGGIGRGQGQPAPTGPPGAPYITWEFQVEMIRLAKSKANAEKRSLEMFLEHKGLREEYITWKRQVKSAHLDDADDLLESARRRVTRLEEKLEEAKEEIQRLDDRKRRRY